jgi:hypothetical protein
MAKFKSEREKAFALDEKITSEELDAMRKEQASHIANRYFPSGTAPWEKMVRNLIESGRLNHKQYIEGGRINPETKYPALDEKMETPSDFINFQKSMVRGPGKNYNSKNEIQGTERA